MEYQLYQAIVATLRRLDKPRTPTRFTFSDEEIVQVYYWSVIHDRPRCWACDVRHWPTHLRQRPLPDPSTLSRRLRTAAVRVLLDALERHVTAPTAPGLFWMIDGKALPIGGCSKDRHAGYGRAAGCQAKGYKLHALVGSDGSLATWRVAPMNKDERVMAQRLLKHAPPAVVGYLVGDTNYDANPLHQVADRRGNVQVVTRRRGGPAQGTGHRKQALGRLRSLALTESPFPAFATQLLQDRNAIERQFGNLVNWGGGLASLPAWVRTHRRVRLWVQAKLALTALKTDHHLRTYVA
jgi:hypothetical protein